MIQNQTYKKQESFSLEFNQWIIASCGFSFILLCARVIATAHLTYVFLLWNLFLAFIPYAISHKLYHTPKLRENKWKLMAGLSVWLLFIPNSFYIITDLYHLDHIASAPKWFDLLLLLSFAWNGLLLGIVSLRRTEMLLEEIKGKSFSLLIVFVVMSLNAFGIYIGRFLRYNSWDIITQPFSLFNETLQIILHPFINIREWGMIFCYAVFMTLLYSTIKKLAENFKTLNQ